MILKENKISEKNNQDHVTSKFLSDFYGCSLLMLTGPILVYFGTNKILLNIFNDIAYREVIPVISSLLFVQVVLVVFCIKALNYEKLKSITKIKPKNETTSNEISENKSNEKIKKTKHKRKEE